MAGATVTQLVLAKPAGVQPGDLMVAVLAITYQPHLLISGPCPGAAPIITPPVGWDTVLADWPNGDNALGDLGAGEECDRVAVFTRSASAFDGVTFTFTWVPGGAVSAAGLIKNFTGQGGDLPSVNVAAAAVRILAAAGANPMTVESPTITPTEPDTLLLAIFVARNGGFPAPGGTAFTVPPGMLDVTPAINLRTLAAGTDPLGLAMFIETIGTAAPTGVRVSSVDQDDQPTTPLIGMGYALAIAGCGGRIPPPPG